MRGAARRGFPARLDVRSKGKAELSQDDVVKVKVKWNDGRGDREVVPTLRLLVGRRRFLGSKRREQRDPLVGGRFALGMRVRIALPTVAMPTLDTVDEDHQILTDRTRLVRFRFPSARTRIRRRRRRRRRRGATHSCGNRRR